MPYEMNVARRDEKQRTAAAASTGIPFWDMMLSFGKASQQVMSAYAPRTEYDARQDRGAAQHVSSNVEVIPMGEETLNVGTRVVSGETTRVRRVVVETPVEKGVSLREERVVVERRKPTGAASTATQGILTDTAIEMSDSYEVADVWKSVRVTEEVVLRREVTERHETVRDTVRRDEVVVEQARRNPPVARQESATIKHEQSPAAPSPAGKPEPEQMAADLKNVAERFEGNGEHREKTPAAAHPTMEAPKTDHKSAASTPMKTAAEQGKASATQNEKSSPSSKS